MSSAPSYQFVNRHLKPYTADSPRGRATLAAFRRGLGKAPGMAPEMHPFVERGLAPADGPLRSDASYVVASLYGLHPEIGDNAFGTALATIRYRESGDEDPGVERRFIALLDAGREQLPDHLRHLISLIKSRSAAPIDYAQLLDDLLDWDAGDRRVQKRWASQFWRSRVPEAEASTEANDETTSDDSPL